MNGFSTEAHMDAPYLTQTDVARRWRISPRSLERWRMLGEGPTFFKIGGAVRYRVEDIEAFEAKQRRSPTAKAR
jgi:hypothetical protein